MTSRDQQFVAKLSDLETSQGKNKDLLELFHQERWDYKMVPTDAPQVFI